jgi:hypothetical protein
MHIPALRFTSSVSPARVHKVNVAEVFPTDVVSVGDDEMWVGVRWPALHAFYRHPAVGVDSYLLTETIRQLTILACHEHYGTPAEARFIMSGIGSSMRNIKWPGGPGEREMAVYLRGESIRRARDGSLQGIRMAASFYADGILVASGHGDAMIVGERVYSRMRGGSTHRHSAGPVRDPGTILAPHFVGHRAHSDVLLVESDDPASFTLSLDLSNTTLFDHALDHVAGMVQVEAARQIVRVVLGNPTAELGDSEFQFLSALEFGPEVTVTTQAANGAFELSFFQGGSVAVLANVRVAGEALATAIPESDSLPGPGNLPSGLLGTLQEERIPTSHEFSVAGLAVP